MEHYVYYHIDPIFNQVKYIGKGKGRRAFDLKKRGIRHIEWIKLLSNQGLEPKIEIVFYGDEASAIKKEEELIKLHRDQGSDLLNVADKGTALGGKKNGMYGRKRPDLSKRNSENAGKTYEEIYGEKKAIRVKEKVSLNSSGKKNPMYGRKGPNAPAFGRTGIAHPMYGKTHTVESKSKISESLRLNRGNKIKCSNGIIYNSLSEAAKILKISRVDISKVLNGIKESHNSYIFQYVNKPNDNTEQS